MKLFVRRTGGRIGLWGGLLAAALAAFAAGWLVPVRAPVGCKLNELTAAPDFSPFSPAAPVVAASDAGTPAAPSLPEKWVCLTFDDGPSDQTGEILDILKEHNVKATFFVIGRNERYYPMYKRIVEEGHTLAIHSYSHEYSTIYASYDNFVNDVEELRKLLYDVTGVDCRYYRFPGGSSNRVTQVPVNDLIDYLDSAGLTYFDWNALNNDAVIAGQTPDQLVK